MRTMRAMGPVSVLIFTLLTLHAATPAAAMDFHAMEDNCILSFVVPRDKVKSSCDMEERVRRRLNAMETKVTLYKQHVMELQEQLGKERQYHQQKIEEFHQRLTLKEQAARTPPPAPAPDPLLDKRLQGLEEELRKMRTIVAASSSPRPSQSQGDKPNGRGAAVGGGEGLGEGGLFASAGRSRQESEKAITLLVKMVVHSEVKKLFDNYTHYVGRYVRDQALAFNQIMNMVPRPEQPFRGVDHLPPKWPGNNRGGRRPGRNDVERGTPTTAATPSSEFLDRDALLINQLEDIRNRLNNTRRNLADRVHDVLKGGINTTTNPTIHPTAPLSTLAPNSDHDNLMDIDSASGDINNDTAGRDHHHQHMAFTATPSLAGNNGSDPAAAVSSSSGSSSPNSLPMPSSPNDEALSSSSSAQSRMSYNADLNKLPQPSGGGDGEGVEGEGDGSPHSASNLSGWQESMVHDQSAGEWIQELLRTKVQEVLQQQVDELVSLVLKHSSMIDTKLHDTQLKFGQLEYRLGADVKQLSQVVNGVKLEMSSVSQGLQTVHGRLDRVAELEDAVTEIRKNISQEGGSRLLATLLDEQGKKVRKMERLTDIYKQSLEHYRNETKLEYRGLKDRLDKESGQLRALDRDLWENVTQHAAQLAHHVNQTATAEMDGIKHRVQVMEDNSLLQQIDLSNFERQMKSRTAKAERDLNKLSQDVGELKHKTRNLQKNLNAAMTGQSRLQHAINSSSIKMRHLQIEVQLNVLDSWVPFSFDYMKTRTDCFGEQYIRKSGFKTGRLVGVVLCNKRRYKIFLGQSLDDTFKNIGDDSGMGEDHCQFVNARSMAKVKVSPFRTSTETEPGYVRTHWGQEPRPELLNIIRPSPAWYECGVSIP